MSPTIPPIESYSPKVPFPVIVPLFTQSIIIVPVVLPITPPDCPKALIEPLLTLFDIVPFNAFPTIPPTPNCPTIAISTFVQLSTIVFVAKPTIAPTSVVP